MAVSDAQKRATLKYKENHYKRVPLDIQREEYDAIKAYADVNGETVNGLIKRLIRQEIGDKKLDFEITKKPKKRSRKIKNLNEKQWKNYGKTAAKQWQND